MPPKNKTPAPIDRPLSRAYLREFTGWSTAYPPGVSEPTSLRLMENVMVNRDGSVRVRPGLRYLNYATVPTDTTPGTADTEPCVGTHETFFTESGRAYLYAVRETDETVGFRVMTDSENGLQVQTLADAGFDVVDGTAAINFTSATTYVKYLQIDNKIFALSNAGETMRMFSVGEQRRAKRLNSITRPEWSVDDKLNVVHPPNSWISGGTPVSTRTNHCTNPTFGYNIEGWYAGNGDTELDRDDAYAHSGGWSLKVTSTPERTNLAKQPLHDVSGASGIDGWSTTTTNPVLTANGDYMRVRIETGLDSPYMGHTLSSFTDVSPQTEYRIAFTLGDTQLMSKLGMMVRYFDSAGEKIGDDDHIDTYVSTVAGRKNTVPFTTPKGCRQIRICPVGYRSQKNDIAWFEIKNVYCGLYSEGDTSALDGTMGADYYWTGAVNNSPSVYHPARDVIASFDTAGSTASWTASAYVRAGSTVRTTSVKIQPRNASNGNLTATTGTPGNDGSGAFTRFSATSAAPAATALLVTSIIIEDVPRGEAHYIDSVLLEKSGTLNAYFSGATADTSGFDYYWTGAAHNSTSKVDEYSGGLTNPSSATKTASTLIASTGNDVSIGMFYTFSNEVGESAASQVTITRVQRAWSAWNWETSNANAEPSGTPTQDPELCADQLVAYPSEAVFDAAIDAGATGWSLYMFTWADGEPFPTSALKIGHRELSSDSVYGADSWIRMTPSQAEVSSDVVAIPTAETRFNSSAPSSGGQGLVAADRMVLVLDPAAQAVIRWSSNQQGAYYDFSAGKGGGYKTLTSGNLQVPACVKLWQNPESRDTLTVLTLGVDGHSTGYYMAPAQIASQSEAVNIMAFEETTATPGTTSPYGCEVLNNALYHPLDDMLMKSNAANYNINHTSMTDMIRNQWQQLQRKDHIVSSQLDNRLYYLVNNPDGLPVEPGCWGNEVWVLDAQQKQGTWSRWLVQGISLRKIERGGQIVMSLVHPTGIFYFDPESSTDHYVDTTTYEVGSRSIPWMLETNTQGANRAHDAWANLQQLDVQVGFFQGQMRYGVRGLDVNGQMQDISKIVRDDNDPGLEAYDLEDYLLIRRVMKEWFFYASSVEVDEVTQPSAGQLSLVQYRYTPSTVNTGYEFGSIETFEYGRSALPVADRTTDNGVPMPYIDTQRP